MKVTDTSPSTVTFTYDHNTDARGLATRTNHSVAGGFSATYDQDGSVATEQLPGGYTLNITTDTTGATTSRVYTRDSDGVSVYSDTITQSIHGQVASQHGWSNQEYDYDKTGRLTGVRNLGEGGCIRRDYEFDQRSNRKALTTNVGSPGAGCPTGGGTDTTSHTYDSADRLVDAGYVYDAFGRTTALPGATVAYYTNDLVRQQTANGTRQTLELDAAHRFRSTKTEIENGSNWIQSSSTVNHYSCDCDKPSWVAEDSNGGLTRNVNSLGGDLAATTGKTGDVVLQFTDIHGDVSLQLPLNASKAPVALETDEYGNPTAGGSGVRYGWLGAKQRAADTPTGFTLMGVRLYNPNTGRFLQQDPVFGGGDNAYGYPADPITMYDLDGRFWGKAWKITVCVGTILWVIGSGFFAVTKVRAIWRAINRLGGIRDAARHVMSAHSRQKKLQRMANIFLVSAATILGLDQVYEKCIKVKW